MPIDPIDFAIEQLRRATAEWVTNTAPQLMEAMDEAMGDVEDPYQRRLAKLLSAGMLVMTFPVDEYRELHDLLIAHKETMAAERDQGN